MGCWQLFGQLALCSDRPRVIIQPETAQWHCLDPQTCSVSSVWALVRVCVWKQAEKGTEPSNRFTVSVSSCVFQCWPKAFQYHPVSDYTLYTPLLCFLLFPSTSSSNDLKEGVCHSYLRHCVWTIWFKHTNAELSVNTHTHMYEQRHERGLRRINGKSCDS